MTSQEPSTNEVNANLMIHDDYFVGDPDVIQAFDHDIEGIKAYNEESEHRRRRRETARVGGILPVFLLYFLSFLIVPLFPDFFFAKVNKDLIVVVFLLALFALCCVIYAVVYSVEYIRYDIQKRRGKRPIPVDPHVADVHTALTQIGIHSLYKEQTADDTLYVGDEIVNYSDIISVEMKRDIINVVSIQYHKKMDFGDHIIGVVHYVGTLTIKGLCQAEEFQSRVLALMAEQKQNITSIGAEPEIATSTSRSYYRNCIPITHQGDSDTEEEDSDDDVEQAHMATRTQETRRPFGSLL